MAKGPDQGEVFLREVDEELRKDRLNRFVARYGWALIAGILLFIGAVGGFIWWQGQQSEQAEAQGTALLEALDAMERGNREAALPSIRELTASDRDGYRAAGLFARAGAEAEAGNAAAAVATLASIASDENLAEPFRQAALVRQTALEFDRLPPAQVIQRLAPLARPGNAWFGTAGELVGVAHLKMGRADLAGPLFARIARDRTVPPTIRTRAVQMAGSLGINALPEAGGVAETADGNGAEAREKTE